MSDRPNSEKERRCVSPGNTVHHDFQRNGDLLLHLLRGNARPLGHDLYIVIRYIGISFDGEVAKGKCARNEQNHRDGEDQEPVVERKVYEGTNHFR